MTENNEKREIIFEVHIDRCHGGVIDCDKFRTYKGRELLRRCTGRRPHRIFEPGEWLSIPEWCPILEKFEKENEI